MATIELDIVVDDIDTTEDVVYDAAEHIISEAEAGFLKVTVVTLQGSSSHPVVRFGGTRNQLVKLLKQYLSSDDAEAISYFEEYGIES